MGHEGSGPQGDMVADIRGRLPGDHGRGPAGRPLPCPVKVLKGQIVTGRGQCWV